MISEKIFLAYMVVLKIPHIVLFFSFLYNLVKTPPAPR